MPTSSPASMPNQSAQASGLIFSSILQFPSFNGKTSYLGNLGLEGAYNLEIARISVFPGCYWTKKLI